MKKFKNLCKTKGAKILAVLFMAGLLVFSFAPSINADGPIFNGLPGDKKLIRGANATQNPGSNDYSDPVSGSSGDAIEVMVYYHNIVEGTTARNTRISVILPEGEKTTQVLNAKLWAGNADAIKDSLTINADETVRVEYIPGSTVWYPNAQSNPGASGQPLPDGITTPAGVNIGDIQGCWQFAGFVSFQVRLMHTPTPPPGEPKIALEKFVSSTSLGSGNYNWAKELEVKPNDEVIYRLSIHNDGTAAATGVIVKDVLPNNVDYIAGTATLYTSTGTLALPDSLFGQGAEIANIGRGESVYITFKAKVKAEGICAKLTNLGVVTAASGLKSQDTAIVSVCTNPKIIKSKSAWNVSQNIDATKVVAKENEIIEYHLITKNVGDALENDFQVIDDLSDILDNAQVISIQNGGQMQGVNLVYPRVDINAGQTLDYTFKVKINKQAPNSDFRLRNVYGNEVIIDIERPKPPVIQNPHLTIDKLVRNVTSGETAFVKENNAKSGQAIEYKLIITNDGTGEATDVKLRDVLPISVSYLSNSISILLPNGQVITAVNLFNQDIAVGNLKPGESIVATFQARVNGEIACGSRIENKAITTSGILRAQSFAYTNVVCEKVTTPQVKGISILTPTGTPLMTLAIVALVIMVIGSAIIVYKYKI